MARRKQIDSRGTSDKKQPDFELNSKTKKTVKPENLCYREWMKYKNETNKTPDKNSTNRTD